MQQQIASQLENYKNERNALIAEANERSQRHQQMVNEHTQRMNEMQMRVTHLEGAIHALEQLRVEPDAPQTERSS